MAAVTGPDFDAGTTRVRRRFVRRFVGAWVVVLLLGGCLWWGIHPPRTETAYRRESASTLALLRSDVETARLWLDAVSADKVTSAAAEVALTETDSDASRRSSSYAAYQPPDREASELRSKVSDLADRVATLLGDIRVAARAGRWDEAIALRPDLTRLSDQLRRVQRLVAP